MMKVIGSMGPDNKRDLDIQVGVSTAVGAVAAIALGLGLGLGLGQGWERSLSLAISGGFLTGLMMAGSVSPFLPKKKEEDRLDDGDFVFIPGSVTPQDPESPVNPQSEGVNPPPVLEGDPESPVDIRPEEEKAPIVFDETGGRAWFEEIVKHKDFPQEATTQGEIGLESLKALFDYAHHFGQAKPGEKMPYTEEAEALCMKVCAALPGYEVDVQTRILDVAVEVARRRMADH